jgi:hypothetical protein
MSNTKTGGPAFPTERPAMSEYGKGMTLRDYFAAKALQGMVASMGWQGGTCKTVASVAYEMADAMLAEREAA